MQHPIRIYDCDFEIAESEGPGGNLEVRMKLPRVIDLKGIKCVQDHPFDHHHYRNEFGSFFIDCSRHASYYPPAAVCSIAEHFESLSRFTSEFDMFRISHYSGLEGQLKSDMSKEEIIRVIGLDKELASYLDYFFKWLNRFKEINGENHLRMRRIEYITLDCL